MVNYCGCSFIESIYYINNVLKSQLILRTLINFKDLLILNLGIHRGARTARAMPLYAGCLG